MRKTLELLRAEVEEEISINLTPLIDVVFVVLIMFILVAPLVEVDRIQLAGGGDGKKPDMVSFQENAPLKIYVYADNTIWMNGIPLTPHELYQELQKAYRLNPSLRPQLYHDKSASFGTYQSVKNTIESVGFDSLDVILKPG